MTQCICCNTPIVFTDQMERCGTCGTMNKNLGYQAPPHVFRRSECCGARLEYVAMYGRIISYKCPVCGKLVNFKK